MNDCLVGTMTKFCAMVSDFKEQNGRGDKGNVRSPALSLLLHVPLNSLPHDELCNHCCAMWREVFGALTHGHPVVIAVPHHSEVTPGCCLSCCMGVCVCVAHQRHSKASVQGCNNPPSHGSLLK